MKVILVAIAYSLFFVAVEIIAKKSKLKKETSRKLVHILSGTTAAFMPFILSFREIVYLSILFIPVMLASKKANVFSSIHEVKRNTYGEVYFPVAILVTALMFPEKPLYIYGILVMALGDGLASIIGQRYGKQKFSILGGQKSYVGSATFFLITMFIGLAVLVIFGISALPAIVFSISMAAILTAVEACLSYGLDNLVLPPLAASLMFLVINVWAVG